MSEERIPPVPKAEAKPKAHVRRPRCDWTEGGISMNSLMHKIYNLIIEEKSIYIVTF